MSWAVRPLWGALMFYGAWRNSWLLLALGILAVSTSWFWFRKPKRNHPWAERFIDVEREYLTPPWTRRKVIGLLFVAVFLVVVTIAFWRHNALLGLSVFVFGALLKAVWSSAVAQGAGILAAVIGVVSAAVATGLLYWYLTARAWQ